MFRFIAAWLLLACSCAAVEQPNGAARLDLPDGRVLMAGGDGSLAIEVLDPASGAWTRVGTLLWARSDFAATLLPDGNVLFTGGSGADGEATASAEIFEIASGVSTSAGEMSAVRRGHAARLLPNNNRVLVTGGGAEPELYIPWRGVFVRREPGNATLQAGRTADGILLYGSGWKVGEALEVEVLESGFRAPVAADSFGRLHATIRSPAALRHGTEHVTVQGSAAEAMAVLPGVNAPVNTVTTVIPSQNPSGPGASVTFTGIVIVPPPGSAVPSGVVSISDSLTPSLHAQGNLDGTGHFSILVTGLTVGLHVISATYLGTISFASSTGSVVQTVGQTLTQVIASPTSPAYGTALTLTAIVSYSPAGSPPVGTVTFYDGATVLNSSPALLISGAATYTLATPLLPGGHMLTGKFTPSDGNSLASTSPSLPLTVRQATSTPTATASVSSANIGQAVTISITMAAATGAPKPTGTVQVKDGSQLAGNAPLNNGAASVIVTFSKAGTHALELDYSGDALYLASVGGVAVTVNQITSTATMTATPSSASLGQAIALAAQVGPTPPTGVSAPTGTVQFLDGTQPLAVLALTGSVATMTASNLAAGTHQISASYSGDVSWVASKSAAVTVTVAQASTAVQLTSTQATPFLGQTVILTAALQTASGAPQPTGAVQFADGARVLGGVALSGGKASLSTTFLVAGSHTVTATYGGDTNYSAASATLNETVNPLNGTLTLTPTPTVSTFGQTVTLNAQLSAPAGGSGIASPTGTIQILEGPVSLASLNVSSTGASTTISNFSPGTHSLSASYSGDSNWLAVNSAVVVLVVGPAPTITTLSSPPASASDTQMTLTATVTSVNTVPLAPSGTVQFVDQNTGAVLANIPLAGRTATATVAVTADAIVATYSGDPNFASSTSTPLSRIAMVNGAAFTSSSFAPEELVTIFGTNLATSTSTVSVTVTDVSGISQSAFVFFAGPTQINAVLPAGIVDGPATLAVRNAAGATFTSAIGVTRVAPGLFSADASGQGLAAAQIIRVHDDLSQTVEDVGSPIDVTTGTAFLVLYGTGIRNRSANAAVSCTINGTALAVAYAGPQPQFPGLDQVDVQLPASLKGAGPVKVLVTADGKVSNTVTITIQ